MKKIIGSLLLPALLLFSFEDSSAQSQPIVVSHDGKDYIVAFRDDMGSGPVQATIILTIFLIL